MDALKTAVVTDSQTLGSSGNAYAEMTNRAFRGLPVLSSALPGHEESRYEIVKETPPFVWCHRAGETLPVAEARQKFRSRGADDPDSGPCLSCSLCLD